MELSSLPRSIHGDPEYIHFRFQFNLLSFFLLFSYFYVSLTILVTLRMVVLFRQPGALNSSLQVHRSVFYTFLSMQSANLLFYILDNIVFRIPPSDVLTSWLAATSPALLLKSAYYFLLISNYLSTFFSFLFCLVRLVVVYFPESQRKKLSVIFACYIPLSCLLPLLFTLFFLPATVYCRQICAPYSFGAVYFTYIGAWHDIYYDPFNVLVNFSAAVSILGINGALLRKIRSLVMRRTRSSRSFRAEVSLTLMTLTMNIPFLANVGMTMNSSSSVIAHDFHDGLSLTAAVLVLTFGVFGVVTNASIVYIFSKERSERTSFNLICVFRAASNVVILSTTFLLVFFPKILLGFVPYSPALESCLIHLSLTLYLGNEYQIILVAFNRFFALFLPFYYTIICGVIPTFILLALIYGYRLVIVVFEQRPLMAKQCYTSFSTDLLAWIYDQKLECAVEDNILEVILFTFVTMTIINVITFLKIITFYLSRNQSATMDEETKRRIRRNILLFFQTMLQDSLYLIDLTFTFKLSSLSNHRFWTFVSVTFVWECIHSIDGFIMMMFNERLSLLKKRFQPKPSSTVTRGPQISVSILPSVG